MAEAELEVARVLEACPDSLDALSLFAKIKHINGELSKAIACWAQIQARSPHGATAPAGRGAPALFHAHDPRLYKLAVIAGASLAERCGDLASARTQLERLGHERGFEHDLDRLCALARVYEQLGTPEALASAARICRHVLDELERCGVERLSMLGRLASLERRAGRAEIAAEIDARFLDGMRRRMHRPSLHDLVRVAAREYLPLERLRAVRPAGDHLPAELPRRERALGHALAGELEPARALFADGREPLDRRYLAELALIEGDEDRAIELFLGTLRDGPEDPSIIGWLLDRHARAPSAAIAGYWADPERRARAFALLEAGCQLAPLRPEPWRRLATLHELAGDAQTDLARRCAARAGVLAEAAAAREMPIGRVLAAGVYHLAGKAKGLLHEVWVHRTPASPGRGGTLADEDIHGNLAPELRAAIRNAFVAVREYVRAKLPHAAAELNDYTYSYKLPKEDEMSGGLSAGLPSALAFLSVFLQRPVSRAIAASGTLISEAHDVITVGPIGEAEYKVKAAYHGNLRSLILPLANRAELGRSTLVPSAIAGDLVCYAADLDQAMKLVFGADVFTRP